MTNRAKQQHTRISAMDLTVETWFVVSCDGLEVRAFVDSIIAYPGMAERFCRWLSKFCQGACPR